MAGSDDRDVRRVRCPSCGQAARECFTCCEFCGASLDGALRVYRRSSSSGRLAGIVPAVPRKVVAIGLGSTLALGVVISFFGNDLKNLGQGLKKRMEGNASVQTAVERPVKSLRPKGSAPVRDGIGHTLEPVEGSREKDVPRPTPAPVVKPKPTPPPVRWVHTPDWYRHEADVMEGNVRGCLSAPYSLDRNLADRVLAALGELKSAVGRADAAEAERLFAAVLSDYRRFEQSCRWQSGVPHPTYAHVFSSHRPNTWSAERGWEFVHPGTADLTVRRVVIYVRCGACRGNGTVVSKSVCTRCGGRGQIPNPAAVVGGVIGVAADLLGKHGRKPRPRRLNVPVSVSCPDCVRGYRKIQVPCGQCNGAGKVPR